MGRLDGKVALVSGAASGIGAAIATVFVKEGATTFIADVQVEKGKALAGELGDAAHFIELDVTDEARWKQVVDAIVSQCGKLDILVNNAGVSMGVQRLDRQPAEDFDRIMQINVNGVWYGMRSVVAPMEAQGGGSIVNISSMNGLIGVAGMTDYAATKFAVTGMTRSAALELGGLGIRVNSIHPGIIETPGVAGLSAEVRAGLEESVKRQATKRLGRPEEIARAVLFFASDDSSYCNGSMLLVDGGHAAGRYRDLDD